MIFKCATSADGEGRCRWVDREGEQIKTLATQISEHLALHPDAQIFTSLARAGAVRAARLLAEIGHCRARFPDPNR